MGWEIFMGLGFVLIALAVWAWARGSDYRHGREAYRNGLRLNTRWGERMKQGWRDAFDDDRLAKRAKR